MNQNATKIEMLLMSVPANQYCFFYSKQNKKLLNFEIIRSIHGLA